VVGDISSLARQGTNRYSVPEPIRLKLLRIVNSAKESRIAAASGGLLASAPAAPISEEVGDARRGRPVLQSLWRLNDGSRSRPGK
jgi:hypothetical protein